MLTPGGRTTVIILARVQYVPSAGVVDFAGCGWAAPPAASAQGVWLLLVELGVPHVCLCWTQTEPGTGPPWENASGRGRGLEGKPILTSTFQAFACIMCVNLPLAKQIIWLNPRSRSKLLQSHPSGQGAKGDREGKELGPRIQSTASANSVTAQYSGVDGSLVVLFLMLIFLNENTE